MSVAPAKAPKGQSPGAQKLVVSKCILSGWTEEWTSYSGFGRKVNGFLGQRQRTQSSERMKRFSIGEVVDKSDYSKLRDA